MKITEKIFMFVSALIPLALVICVLIWGRTQKISTDIVSHAYETETHTQEQESETTVGQELWNTNREDIEKEIEKQTEQQTIPVIILETTEPETEEDPFPYSIRVNRALNCITVYEKDSYGEYSIPYKAMICSTGGATPKGSFHTKAIYTVKALNGGVYGQYSTWITGNILFHSVPSRRPTKDSLIANYYNQLGTKASAGCIRLTVADAKWIYDNCPVGTLVEVYDDWDDPGVLGKPQAIKVPPDTVWDPTDPDPENPWHESEPQIEVLCTEIDTGDVFLDENHVKAYDTCGNEITDQLIREGDVDSYMPGKYVLHYTITDTIGKVAEREVTIVVKEDKMNVGVQGR